MSVTYKKNKKKKKKLPDFFKPLFWSCKFSSITPAEHIKTIIVNTVNYGSWRHWQWLVKYYGARKLKAAIENIPASEFREGSLRLISLLLNIKKMKYASRGAKIKAERGI